MKVISFTHNGRAGYGALIGDKIADFSKVGGADAPDLKTAITKNLLATLAKDAKPDLALADVTLDLPVTNPDKIICVQLNYDMSGKGRTEKESEYPVIFTRYTDSHVAHGADIIKPASSDFLDFEGELAVIIGKTGRHIPKDKALSYVAGYTCYNDGSVRDWQRHTHQFTPGKNFPKSGSYGPWMLTPDELPDPRQCRIVTRVNDKEMQNDSVGNMYFPTEELIAYISTFTTLNPGDIIATGTPGGVGFRRDPQVYLKVGDVLEIDISPIGVLRNPIAAEKR